MVAASIMTLEDRTSLRLSDGSLLIAHPDDTREIDALDDAVTEIAGRLHAAGPVIKGRGFTNETGAAGEFAGITFPNTLTPPRMTHTPPFFASNCHAIPQVHLR